MIMTPVRDPEEDTPTALDHWERSCDNCGKYCPPNEEFYTGHTMRELKNGQPVYITFGVCKNHKW